MTEANERVMRLEEIPWSRVAALDPGRTAVFLGFADASNKRGRGPSGPRSAVGCGSCALESYTQQMKDQDERPSQYSEDGTDDHGDYVDGDVVREEQIRQKEED